MNASISPSERRSVHFFALLLTLLTFIPYGVAWQLAGEDWSFNGFTFGVDDGNAYLGKMRLGAEGDWAFHLFYTSEEHEAGFGLYLPYILIGQLTRLTLHPSSAQMAEILAVAFQIWRMMACYGLILVYHRFLAFFLHRRADRFLALLLITLGGGLGWVLLFAGQSNFLGSAPVEFYIPEGFSFLALYGLPHVATGRLFLLLGFMFLLMAHQKKNWQLAIMAGLCWNLVGLMVTFYLAVIYAVLAAWGLALWLKWKQFPHTLTIMGGISAGLTVPLFGYSLWLFTSNSAFEVWSAQNYLPSPHPLHYLIGYGMLGIFAIYGGQLAWQRARHPENSADTLLVAWVLLVPILVYLPLNVQRRLSEGVIIPLVILAVLGWRVLRPSRRIRFGLVMILFASSMLLWLGTTLILLVPQCTPEVCLYRPEAERVAMTWLENQAEPEAIVLASFRTGNYLPIHTDLQPLLGLGTETLYSEEKFELMERFYRGQMTPDERNKFLQTYHIRYIWAGELERALQSDTSLWNQDLSLLYDKHGYQIYEVPQ